MTPFQQNFEDLIASSLSALDEIAFENTSNHCFNHANIQSIPKKCANLQSSGSVDDFLADYRHEDASILQFMSCLEEPERPSMHLHKSSPPASEYGPAHSTQPRQEVNMRQDPSNDLKINVVRSNASSKPKAGVDASLKPMRVRLPAEGKAERRREKNREYQRRFREKKMRLKFQEMFACTPLPCPGSYDFQ